MNIADMDGYFVGASSYEILSITDNRMKVRVIQNGNPFLLGIIFLRQHLLHHLQLQRTILFKILRWV
jgi:hypothetical protein